MLTWYRAQYMFHKWETMLKSTNSWSHFLEGQIGHLLLIKSNTHYRLAEKAPVTACGTAANLKQVLRTNKQVQSLLTQSYTISYLIRHAPVIPLWTVCLGHTKNIWFPFLTWLVISYSLQTYHKTWKCCLFFVNIFSCWGWLMYMCQDWCHKRHTVQYFIS